MKYQAILFDMDGTLVPMDTDSFIRVYFGALAKELCPLGVAPKALTEAVWSGTAAMVKNDGRVNNREVFWRTFSELTGLDAERFIPAADAFYSEGFHAARAATQPNPLAAEAVRLARQLADKVILATNPLFPMAGQITRMSWVGLKPDDFDLVTSYESDHFCKPNPAYYLSICERMGLDPHACLMIGNDEGEDMRAAASVGMDTYLVNDCRIPAKDYVYDGPCGTFAQLVEFLGTETEK